MHWQDDSDEKKRQQWKSRVARERLDLSASVEEALSDGSTLRELEAEEFDDFEPEAEEAVLIPPRLSLQSKPLPAIRALPKVRTDHLPLVTKEVADSSSTEFARTVQKKRRSTMSTTKVRLQVVPKSEVFEDSVAVPFDETVTNPGLPAVESLRGLIVSPSPEVDTAISGSANCEKGQSEIMVVNACITLKSVVVVMLTADPGPVVVQYVSLQPGVGFTVHLSAPTQKPTTFNYRICQD
jgi:hypothetical protein